MGFPGKDNWWMTALFGVVFLGFVGVVISDRYFGTNLTEMIQAQNS
jgi:hypothetical protein